MEAATTLDLLPRCGLSPLLSDSELEPFFQKAAELRASSEARFPWIRVLELIDQVKVEDFKRHPDAQTLYDDEFLPLLREKYGSASAFISYRLQLPPLATSEQFKANSQVRVMLADWPYSFEANVGHFIVWTRFQLLCRAMAEEEDWETLQKNGLCGYSANESAGYGTGLKEHGAEIRKFVLTNWPEEVYETTFFVNPVRFQSIQDLAHFHVLVRRK